MTSSDQVTLRRIAAECGMSLSGVSKILRNAYKGNTPKGKRRVEEVTKIARKLGYIANGPARRLRSGRNHAIAILAPVDSFGHPEHTSFEFINGCAAALAAESYALTLLNIPRFEERLAMNALMDRSVDGVIVLDVTTPELEQFLERSSIPAMYLNVAPRDGLPTASRDEYAAARAVMELTIGLGYRRFIIAGGWDSASHFSHLQRAAAIADVAKDNPNATFLYSGVPSWFSSFEKSIAACKPDANTLIMAIDASTALRLPYCLPANHPMACCDDTHQFAVLAPWLTRSRYDRADLGRMAAAKLLRHLKDGTPLTAFTVESQIVVGASTPSRIASVNR